MNNNNYLNDLIQLRGHRVAYNKFINSLNQKLTKPITTEQKIAYLDFCSDFVYGEKQELYRIFAELSDTTDRPRGCHPAASLVGIPPPYIPPPYIGGGYGMRGCPAGAANG